MFWEAAVLSLALPAYGAVHESLAGLPAGWQESTYSVSDDSSIELQVALQYQNLDSLESKLASVSTPDSRDYGKYLEKEDLEDLFAPSSDAVDQVKAWLTKSGASDIEYESGILNFRSSVGEANKMLDAKFGLYTDGESTKLRTLAYSVPDELGDVIDLVSPTTYFGGTKAHAAIPKAEPESVGELVERVPSASVPSACKGMNIVYDNVTFDVLGPECFKALYNVGNYKVDPSSGSTIAFGSFLNESASYSDLKKFERIYDIDSQSFKVTLINGGVNNQDPVTELDGEANLDVQNIIGIAGGLPVSEYITGGKPPFIPDLLSPNQSVNQNEPYLQYYQYLLSQSNDDLPYVITNSYGDHENTVPEKYAKRVCNMIGMMGMRGRTILESSGDEGVGAVCRANTGAKQPEFTPIFPATCPYLTSVGGLQSLPEEAWVGSSGGFSFYFSTPWYQKSAVSTYLSKYISAATKKYYAGNGYVDFQGRGFPDISAHSLTPDYLTVINGTKSPNGGTSAASPIVAAIVALLNDARFRDGKPSMGFINPWLYNKAAPAAAVNDVTTGGSKGCHLRDLQSGEIIPGAGLIRYASWNATVGWDPVTGVGSPNFQKLKALALK